MGELRPVVIHLVDPSDGRSLQSWSFATPVITIGRDDASSIVLTDPYVSRTHVELKRGAGGWRLTSKGRNGVLIDGRSVEEQVINSGVRFRLGTTGPCFRFEEEVTQTSMATLSFDPESLLILKLNSTEVAKEAEEVSSTDYFRQLQQKARELRRQRNPS